MFTLKGILRGNNKNMDIEENERVTEPRSSFRHYIRGFCVNRQEEEDDPTY